jgi:hypothetical protein
MSAHWVEVWSPGLQAVGGLIELLGLWNMVREWRMSMFEPKAKTMLDRDFLDNPPEALKVIRQLDDALKKMVQILGEHGVEYSSPVLKELGDRRASIDEKIRNAQTARQEAFKNIYDFRVHRYVIGILLIAFGAMTQISANVIAWAGAYGLFG